MSVASTSCRSRCVQRSPLVGNRLTIRLQPQEEIALLLMNKTPTLTQGGLNGVSGLLNILRTWGTLLNTAQRLGMLGLMVDMLIAN